MTTYPSWAAGLLSLPLLVVRIFAADTAPPPPEVRIVSPPGGSVFAESSDILVLAGVKDSDGPVLTVQFFANGASLGVVTNQFPGPRSEERRVGKECVD